MINKEIKEATQVPGPVARLNWLGAVARDATLPASAVRIAAVLADRYINSQSGIAWPSQERMARDLQTSVDTIRRAVTALSKAGHLVIEEAGRPGHSARYRIVKTPARLQGSKEDNPSSDAGIEVEDLSIFAAGIPAKMPVQPSQECKANLKKEPKEKKLTNISLACARESENFNRNDLEEKQPKKAQNITFPADEPNRADKLNRAANSNGLLNCADDTFAEFWRHYPRREAKVDAQKAFRAALKAGADPGDIIAGAQRYSSVRAAEPDPAARQRYTAMPAKWLRDKRWRDVVLAPAASVTLDGLTGLPLPASAQSRPAARPAAFDPFGFAAAYVATMGAA